MARYPARKAIKDKDWPKYIERALRAVADNEKLKKYDVLPPLLRDQYDVIGWLQVRSQLQGQLCIPLDIAAASFPQFSLSLQNRQTERQHQTNICCTHCSVL